MENLLIMERVNGSWKITEVNTVQESISRVYAKFSSDLDMDKYATRSDDGFTLKEAKFTLNHISASEKRVLMFNLQKLMGIVQDHPTAGLDADQNTFSTL